MGRQASVLDRSVPLMSRGISVAQHGRWAAYAMRLGYRVEGLDLGFRASSRFSGLHPVSTVWG